MSRTISVHAKGETTVGQTKFNLSLSSQSLSCACNVIARLTRKKKGGTPIESKREIVSNGGFSKSVASKALKDLHEAVTPILSVRSNGEKESKAVASLFEQVSTEVQAL